MSLPCYNAAIPPPTHCIYRYIQSPYDGPLTWTSDIVLLEDKTAAFIVRVWLETRELPDALAELRGSIEHVASGKTGYLTDLDEIAGFIRPFLETLDATLGRPIS